MKIEILILTAVCLYCIYRFIPSVKKVIDYNIRNKCYKCDHELIQTCKGCGCHMCDIENCTCNECSADKNYGIYHKLYHSKYAFDFNTKFGCANKMYDECANKKIELNSFGKPNNLDKITSEQRIMTRTDGVGIIHTVDEKKMNQYVKDINNSRALIVTNKDSNSETSNLYLIEHGLKDLGVSENSNEDRKFDFSKTSISPQVDMSLTVDTSTNYQPVIESEAMTEPPMTKVSSSGCMLVPGCSGNRPGTLFNLETCKS